jgi:hypothetical protein
MPVVNVHQNSRPNTRSMLSNNFMHSHISEVIPEENTASASNMDTEERASNYYALTGQRSMSEPYIGNSIRNN